VLNSTQHVTPHQFGIPDTGGDHKRGGLDPVLLEEFHGAIRTQIEPVIKGHG
jgi:hypothetical protein